LFAAAAAADDDDDDDVDNTQAIPKHSIGFRFDV
jgi:hypothetical protein